MTWLEGQCLAQTVFTCLYTHDVTAIEDRVLKVSRISTDLPRLCCHELVSFRLSVWVLSNPVPFWEMRFSEEEFTKTCVAQWISQIKRSVVLIYFQPNRRISRQWRMDSMCLRRMSLNRKQRVRYVAWLVSIVRLTIWCSRFCLSAMLKEADDTVSRSIRVLVRQLSVWCWWRLFMWFCMLVECCYQERAWCWCTSRHYRC